MTTNGESSETSGRAPGRKPDESEPQDQRKGEAGDEANSGQGSDLEPNEAFLKALEETDPGISIPRALTEESDEPDEETDPGAPRPEPTEGDGPGEESATSESIEDETEPVDVEQIMSEIRKEIVKRRSEGIYTDEEIDELSKQKIDVVASPGEISDAILQALREPGQNWNITPEYPVVTHRGGLGKLIVPLKKLIRPLVRLYTDHLFYRQAQLNLYLVHLVHNLVKESTRQRLELDRLQGRIEYLAERLEGAEERARTLESMLDLSNPAGDDQ